MSEMSKAREASENFENSKSKFSEPKSDSLVLKRAVSFWSFCGELGKEI